jgi:flagellar hook-basal body protein
LFGLDKDGTLVSSVNGMKVMGWKAVNGEIDPKKDVETLVIPMGTTITPIATSSVKFSGNLDSRMDWEWKLGEAEFQHGDPANPTTYRVELTELGFGQWELRIADGPNHGTVELVLDQTTGSLTIVDNPTSTVDIGGTSFSLNITNDELTISSSGSDLFTASIQRPQVNQTVDVFDSLGNTHSVSFVLTKVDVNEWRWEASSSIPGATGGTGTIKFDSTGGIDSITGDPLVFTPTGAEPVQIMPDFNAVVQNAAEGTLVFESQNGYPQGTLVGFSVDEAGNIIGEYSNGLTEVLGQIAIAAFNNPMGLSRAGDTTYVMSANSGEPKVGQPSTGPRGKITPGSLEMSNVDLSQEFTDMIVTQRGFQANSRIITTSDEMLQELVNLKR